MRSSPIRGLQGVGPRSSSPGSADAAVTARGSSGFSLAEVLIATAVLAAGLLTVAQLFVVSTRANVDAMHATRAVLLASQKIEELRACCAASITTSPAEALHADTPGFVEYIDRRGRPLAGGGTSGDDAVYVRRWRIHALPSHPAGAAIVEVLVTPHRTPLPGSAIPGSRQGEARLTALLPRSPP